MRAAIYARQSRTVEGSESLDTQVAVCKEAAARLGCEVAAVLVEPPSTSGYKQRGRNRPKFLELLDGFKNHQWEMVIAYKTDRLSRGGGPGWAPLLDAIETAGLNVDRAVATPAGFVAEFEIGIRAAMDREESKKTSERLRDVNARNAAQGRPQGSRRPFGYEADLVTIRESEATVLRQMGDRLLHGHNFKDIAHWANRQGYTTAQGRSWYPITVRNCLRNPRYGGIRSYKGTLYPAVWSGIFDAETWDHLQLILKLKSDKAVPPARKYLLTGLVFCGRCGQHLTGQRTQDRPGAPVRRVYQCRTDSDTGLTRGCGGVRRNADALEHFIRELVIYRLDTPALTTLLDNAQDNGQLRELLRQRDEQKQRLGALVDDYATGILDKAQFVRAKTRAQTELERLDSDLEAAQRQQRGHGLVPAGQTVREAWEANPDSWRRELVDLLIKKIVVRPGKTKPFYDVDGVKMRFDPTLIDIEWLA